MLAAHIIKYFMRGKITKIFQIMMHSKLIENGGPGTCAEFISVNQALPGPDLALGALLTKLTNTDA